MISDKIKICHITSVHGRYDDRIFEKQCVYLANEGFEVTLLVNDGIDDEVLNGVEIVSIKSAYRDRFVRIIKTPKLLFSKANIIDADIYQIHDPELLPLGIKLIKKGKKVIYDSHEDLPNLILQKDWLPYILRPFISKLVKIYYRLNLKKFSAVISVTPHIVEKLSKMGGNAIMVTNYPIVEQSVNVAKTLNEYLITPDSLIYSGTVYPESQQELIFDSLEDINNVNYTIVGSIPTNSYTKYTKHSAWKKVNFINFVPRNELNKIYSTATIGLCIFQFTPNLGYRVGTLGSNKLFEYMQYGLPIICSDSILWKERIVDKYNCGICVNPYSKEDVVSAINFLVENKEEAYKMGLNAKKAIEVEFNWDTQFKEYLQIIKKLL